MLYSRVNGVSAPLKGDLKGLLDISIVYKETKLRREEASSYTEDPAELGVGEGHG